MRDNPTIPRACGCPADLPRHIAGCEHYEPWFPGGDRANDTLRREVDLRIGALRSSIHAADVSPYEPQLLDVLHAARLLLAALAAAVPAPDEDSREVERGLAVAEHLLRKVVDYWDGRPLAGHGQHIYEDLLDVLRAITPAPDAGCCRDQITARLLTCPIHPAARPFICRHGMVYPEHWCDDMGDHGIPHPYPLVAPAPAAPGSDTERGQG